MKFKLSTFSFIPLKNAKLAFLFVVCSFLMGSSSGQSSILFDSDEILEFTLYGDLNTVFKDRRDESPYHTCKVQYKTENNSFTIPIKIKTRGHFRKISSNCKYPPILLNFAKSTTPEESVFYGQDKMKLVTPCRSEEFVVQEYLVYKLYNLVTPKSLRARLVKVIYQDSVKNKSTDPLYGVLLEEEDQMARRNKSEVLKVDGMRPGSVQEENFLKMAVFQYLIGNTDWSVQYQQNIILLADELGNPPSAVPYDFDHAGIVRAPYAKPAEELNMSSTLERRYRGHCVPEMEKFQEVFEFFNHIKDDLYAVYDGNPLLSSSYQKKTLKFLDQFFETINDPKKAQKAFTYPCDPSGTGNVVIKGLRK